LTEGIRALEAGLSSGWAGIVRAIVQLVPLGFALAWLEPRLALVATSVLAVFAVMLRSVRTRVAHLQRTAHASKENLVAAADDAVRHADVWRVFGAEAKAKARVRTIGDAIARRSARLAAISAAVSGANEVLAALALLAIVGAAHAGWLGAVRVERLLPFVVTFFLAYKPLRDFAEAQLALGRARAAWASIGPMLDDSESAPASARSFDLAPLEIDAVVLPHGTERPISLRVAPGTILVVRGPTGAGKTTLLRVLLGLEAQSAGSIRWDGEPLAEASGRARPFAWVPQDTPVLDDSLEENIGLGRAVDTKAILESIGAEHLRKDTRKLSGGERQLVSIARALATDRPVILFDEPTSGLDAESQALVLRAIESLRGKRTIVIVTHRPEPLAIADDVVELGRSVAPSEPAACIQKTEWMS
jgi:ABC-type multidrug transport system fused ATPase/permease subunit